MNTKIMLLIAALLLAVPMQLYSAATPSCSNFVVTAKLGTSNTLTCSWSGGVLDGFSHLNTPDQITLTVTGVSDGKTYLSVTRSSANSCAWNEDLAPLPLPAQSYTVNIVASDAGSACQKSGPANFTFAGPETMTLSSSTAVYGTEIGVTATYNSELTTTLGVYVCGSSTSCGDLSTATPLNSVTVGTYSTGTKTIYICTTSSDPTCLQDGTYTLITCMGDGADCSNLATLTIQSAPAISVPTVMPISDQPDNQYTVSASVANPPSSYTVAFRYCAGSGCVPTSSSTLMGSFTNNPSPSSTYCESPTYTLCLTQNIYNIIACITYSSTTTCSSTYTTLSVSNPALTAPKVAPTNPTYDTSYTMSSTESGLPSSYTANAYYCSGACTPTASSTQLGSTITSSLSFSLCSTPGSPSCLSPGPYNAIVCASWNGGMGTSCSSAGAFSIARPPPNIVITGPTPPCPNPSSSCKVGQGTSVSITATCWTGDGCEITSASPSACSPTDICNSCATSTCTYSTPTSLGTGTYSYTAEDTNTLIVSSSPVTVVVAAPPVITCNGQSTCYTAVGTSASITASSCSGTGACQIYLQSPPTLECSVVSTQCTYPSPTTLAVGTYEYNAIDQGTGVQSSSLATLIVANPPTISISVGANQCASPCTVGVGTTVTITSTCPDSGYCAVDTGADTPVVPVDSETYVCSGTTCTFTTNYESEGPGTYTYKGADTHTGLLTSAVEVITQTPQPPTMGFTPASPVYPGQSVTANDVCYPIGSVTTDQCDIDVASPGNYVAQCPTGNQCGFNIPTSWTSAVGSIVFYANDVTTGLTQQYTFVIQASPPPQITFSSSSVYVGATGATVTATCTPSWDSCFVDYPLGTHLTCLPSSPQGTCIADVPSYVTANPGTYTFYANDTTSNLNTPGTLSVIVPPPPTITSNPASPIIVGTATQVYASCPQTESQPDQCSVDYPSLGTHVSGCPGSGSCLYQLPSSIVDTPGSYTFYANDLTTGATNSIVISVIYAAPILSISPPFPPGWFPIAQDQFTLTASCGGTDNCEVTEGSQTGTPLCSQPTGCTTPTLTAISPGSYCAVDTSQNPITYSCHYLDVIIPSPGSTIDTADLLTNNPGVCGLIATYNDAESIIFVLGLMLMVLGGALYGAGTFLDVRSRAIVQSYGVGMVIGGLIGIAIAVLAPYILYAITGYSVPQVEGGFTSTFTC